MSAGGDVVERGPAWSDAADEILGGDLAVALAQVTPARGAVLTPVTNFGPRDRDAATVTVPGSLGRGGSWTGWLESIEQNWVRFMGPRHLGPLWDRWMRVFRWERIGVRIVAHRAMVWPELGCRGEPEVFGAPLCAEPPAPHPPPPKGTALASTRSRWARGP